MTKTEGLIFEDAFNLLCGNLLGSGIHRKVYECRIKKEWVVKVEYGDDWRYFSNVHEMKFWNDNEYVPSIKRWLAPCHYLSPEGRLLIQTKVDPIRSTDKLPKNLPSFLTDTKRENFGYLNGKLVSVDYVTTVPNPSLKPKRAIWD